MFRNDEWPTGRGPGRGPDSVTGRREGPAGGGPGEHAGPGRHHHGPFGFGRRGPHGFFAGGGRPVRRGDVRAAIVALLAEQPMHGYQVIQELAERSGGVWQPSAGSVYPTLQQLEDEGLVRAEERDGRRVFTLTEAGREEAAARPGTAAPWAAFEADRGARLRAVSFEVVAAAVQVGRVGGAETVGRAEAILAETRRQLYRLLAEDDAPAATATPADRETPPES